MRKGTETTGRRPKNRAPRGQFLLAHAPFYEAAGQDEIAPFAGHCFPLDFSTKVPATQDAAGSFKVFTGVPLLARETVRGDKDEKRSIYKRRRAGVTESPVPSRQKGRNQKRRAV